MSIMSGPATFPEVALEQVQIAPDKVIVATPKKVWVYQADLATDDRDDITSSISHRQQVTMTQKLLDTSIVLAKRAVSPPLQALSLSPVRWVWYLARQYHLTRVTPPLMEEAAERFAATGRNHLAHWAEHKAIEERGHDRLALLDIQALGYNANAVVKALVPPSAIDLVNFFTRSVQTSDPINCVGYVYALERLATAIGKEQIQAIEAYLPQNVHATRCLRVHSDIGIDGEHAQELIELVAELTPQERTQITIACYETARLYFNQHQADNPSNEELRQCLKPLELRPQASLRTEK